MFTFVYNQLRVLFSGAALWSVFGEDIIRKKSRLGMRIYGAIESGASSMMCPC